MRILQEKKKHFVGKLAIHFLEKKRGKHLAPHYANLLVQMAQLMRQRVKPMRFRSIELVRLG